MKSFQKEGQLMKKNGWMYIIALLSLLCCAILFPVSMIHAEEGNKTLELNDTWVTGSIGGEGDRYNFSVGSKGILTIDYTQQSEDRVFVEVSKIDSDIKKTAGGLVAEDQKTTVTETMGLEPGNYELKVRKSYSSDKTEVAYALKASFKAVSNNETEPNDTFETAMPLKQNTMIYGFCTYSDELDCYKVTLPKKQAVSIRWTTYIEDSDIYMYDNDFRSIKLNKYDTYNTGENNPCIYQDERVLEAGNYYIVVRGGVNSGRYLLSFITNSSEGIKARKITVKAQEKLAAKKSAKLKAVFTPSNTVNKDVTWSSSDKSVATVDANGKVTGKKPGKVTITVKAKDGSKVKGTCKLMIYPAQASSVKAVSTGGRKMFVVWNYQKGVTGYRVQYSRNKNFKGAKTIYRKQQYLEFARMKNLKKANYYVRVQSYYKLGKKTYYGAWSKVSKTYIK